MTTIKTEGGRVTTRTTHTYIVIGTPRYIRAGATTAEFAAGTATVHGVPFIIGYAATAGAAEKRVARERRARGTHATVRAYRVATGEVIA